MNEDDGVNLVAAASEKGAEDDDVELEASVEVPACCPNEKKGFDDGPPNRDGIGRLGVDVVVVRDGPVEAGVGWPNIVRGCGELLLPVDMAENRGGGGAFDKDENGLTFGV